MTDWQQLDADATPGPWEADIVDGISQHYSRPEPWLPVIEMIGSDSWSGCDHRLRYTEADAEFIAAARTAWPVAERALAEQREVTEQATRLAAQRGDEVARLRGLLRQVRDVLDNPSDYDDDIAVIASAAHLIDESRLLEEQP